MKVSKKDLEALRDHTIEIHDTIIQRSGGEIGVRDIGGLEHAMYEILSSLEKNQERPFYMAAKVYSLLATRHYFFDGNKRISHILAKLILLDSGYVLKPKYKEAVKFIIDIASKNKNIQEIEDWIKSNSDQLKDIDKYVDDFEEEINQMKDDKKD